VFLQTCEQVAISHVTNDKSECLKSDDKNAGLTRCHYIWRPTLWMLTDRHIQSDRQTGRESRTAASMVAITIATRASQSCRSLPCHQTAQQAAAAAQTEQKCHPLDPTPLLDPLPGSQPARAGAATGVDFAQSTTTHLVIIDRQQGEVRWADGVVRRRAPVVTS